MQYISINDKMQNKIINANKNAIVFGENPQQNGP
jgi:hypothetical protein